jgi:hypothetical protein
MEKEEMMALVEKYGMQPCVNNEIENVQEGYYLDAEECIQELDDLAAHYRNSGPDPVYVDAMYTDGGRLGCLYKIYAPRSWFVEETARP